MAGGNLRTVDNLRPGPSGMTLSPDGTKLYVAEGGDAANGGHKIWILDAATLAVEGAYWSFTSDGGPTCPSYLAVTPGQLWFSWGCGLPYQSMLGRIILETGQFDLHVASAADLPDWTCASASLATVPSRPDMLIAGERCSGGQVLRYRIALGGPGEFDLFREAASPEGGGGGVAQLALSSDGSEIVVPTHHPYYHPVLRTSDLTEVRQYPTSPYPNSAAMRSDGLLAAGAGSSYATDVYVFDPGASTPRKTFDFGEHDMVSGGLAVDGDRIFAVTKSSPYGDILTLRIRNF
jgi:DNA-binding beta-propeller fold protein YncE